MLNYSETHGLSLMDCDSLLSIHSFTSVIFFSI